MFIMFNCYLAAPWPTLGHCQGGSLTNPILITAFESYSAPCSKVGSQDLAEHLMDLSRDACESECNALTYQATPPKYF